jgi:hypothetical protein
LTGSLRRCQTAVRNWSAAWARRHERETYRKTMKLIGLIVSLAICLTAATHRAHGQIAQQNLSFSVVGQFQTNYYSTNTTTQTTNETAAIGGVMIVTSYVVKAIAIDLAGTGWTNWNGSKLLREINMNTGAEGIFLRKGNVQTNVSSFFGNSYSNEFRADVLNELGGFTNLVYYANGIETNTTNSVYLGTFTTVSNNPTVTNRIQSAGLFSVSLNTTNMKFNMLAFGNTTGEILTGRLDGTYYARWVDTLSAAGVGNYSINLNTNLFFGRNLYETTNFVGGPAHGSFTCTGTSFSTLPGGP